MKQFQVSAEALQDLRDIWTYSAKTWGVDQANRYVGDIRRTIEALAKGAALSRSAGDVRPGYRKALVGRHAMFFVERGRVLVIVRILHQRMDAERWLK